VEVSVLEPPDAGIALCEGGDVMVDLVGAVSPGDRLLVHAGVAIARVE
jgi:hydrogenase maturation factor